MNHRTEVGVLGATGIVGQHLVSMLDGHPWFRLSWIAASDRSAGRRYGDLPWRLASPLPRAAADLQVSRLEPAGAPELVFSALDASVAGDAEVAFASAGCLVVSNARNHRMDQLVPLVIPEVNPGHLDLLRPQREARGWTTGGIVTNPNCSTIFATMALAPMRQFGIRKVIVSTLQALSGAGYPGVSALDAVGNVIPFIDGEEEKLESETRKLLGTLDHGTVRPADFIVSATTTRVPVADGHTILLSVALDAAPALDELRGALERFEAEPQQLGLPSAPARPLIYLQQEDRPQPKLDVGRDRGMSVHVGRLRHCPVLGYKLVVLGHNTIRGAAGAALLNAELMLARAGQTGPFRADVEPTSASSA